MIRRRAPFRGLQYASFIDFLEAGQRRSSRLPSRAQWLPDFGASRTTPGISPRGGGELSVDIFSDSDALLDGAQNTGSRSSAPGQATPSDERPLRAGASSPGPSVSNKQFPRDRFMAVDRLPYATVITFVTPHLREAHAAQLGPELIALARLTGGRLALDMTQVTDFSCAWINAMLAASQHCEQFGGRLAIMSLNPRLENLLRETGLHRQLYLAGSVKEALQRFANAASRSEGVGLGRWLGLKRVNAA